MDGNRQGETTLSYRRVSRVPVGLFAGRFVTFAACGLLAAAAFAIVEVDALLRFGALNRTVPNDVVLLAAVRFSLDALLVVGCLGVLFRRPRARRVLRAFAVGEAAEIAATVIITLVLRTITGSARYADLPATFALLSVRAIVAYIVRVAANGAHADFYFGRGEGGPNFVLPAVSRATPPSPARFRVCGVDRATGRTATFDSRGATRAAARRSAEHLGLDPATTTIEPIAAADAAAI